MGIAWIIGFTIYFRKRYKRKKLNRQIAAGKAPPKKKPTISEQKVIVPPDPAVLLGHRLPGENAFRAEKDTKGNLILASKLDDKQHIRQVRGVNDVTSGAPATVARISEEMEVPA